MSQNPQTQEFFPSLPKELLERIGDFIEEFVVKYPSRDVRASKIVHDPLWGTISLKPFEIALIDSPLIQRLRQIHQTSLSYLTFPTSTHSRFEHMLGVLAQTNKLIDSLCFQGSYQDLIAGARTDIRLAAILHDCGHGPLSHASEEIYRYCDDMQKLIEKGGKYEGKHPHEVLAHLIVTHPKFRDCITDLKWKYGFDCDLQKIADTIIGKAEDDKKYITQILNGPFDADKIDYIFRDGHFTGLPLTVDLDRLWYCVKIDWLIDEEKEIKKRILMVEYNGMSPLEQILFCKIILFSTIYHHQKVRATDCMFKGIVEYIKNHPNLTFGDRKLKFHNATDFLCITDGTFFSEALLTKDNELREMINNILYRRLFLRALVISPNTIEGLTWDSYKEGKEHPAKEYIDFQKLSQKKIYNFKDLRDFAEEIWRASGRPCLKEEIWIDVPSFPPTGETDETFIKYPSKPEKMSKVFPVHEWVEMYVFHKWKAHVFCPAKCQNKVSKAAQDVLEQKFKFKFNDLAWTSCHISR
ncbi:MAG TPA: HD domain-containing protein [Candidatus Brocadiia bacterium]|nr:HD domain-containing protein [Candidatus Brocadiales bacterium]